MAIAVAEPGGESPNSSAAARSSCCRQAAASTGAADRLGRILLLRIGLSAHQQANSRPSGALARMRARYEASNYKRLRMSSLTDAGVTRRLQLSSTLDY